MRWTAILGGSIGIALASSAASAQAPVPVGSQFQINSYTTLAQYVPSVSMDDDGDFVVVWENEVGDGSGYGIFGRRFNGAGAAQGVDFLVNSYTSDSQRFPRIALDSDGDFVVVWQSNGEDGSSVGVVARRFSSAGSPQNSGTLVNTTIANIQSRPAVGAEANGDFVVVWQSNLQDGSEYGIFLRRFNSSGVALGVETRANSFTAGDQARPAIDLDADGDFVVVWQSLDDSGYGIFGQRFTSAGAPAGPEFQVNSAFTFDQLDASVSLDADGDFVVVWDSLASGFGTNRGVGRRFDSSGTPLAIEFLVSADLDNEAQSLFEVASDADGDFAVSWVSDGVFVRRFRASTMPLHLDLQVNSAQGSSPTVGSDQDGDLVVAWTAIDGSITGVFGRRLAVSPLIDVDGNGVFEALTDGLLMLRFGFGFTGNTLISGAVGGGCTRCDAPSITAYLQGLV